MTGRTCKRREAFSVSLLIGREVWTPSARLVPHKGNPSGGRKESSNRLRNSPRFLGTEETIFPPWPVVDPFWFVPLAGVKHPFPSRTRPLRPPAAMIVRSRACESSAARTFFLTRFPGETGRRAFFLRAGHAKSKKGGRRREEGGSSARVPQAEPRAGIYRRVRRARPKWRAYLVPSH